MSAASVVCPADMLRIPASCSVKFTSHPTNQVSILDGAGISLENIPNSAGTGEAMRFR